MINDNEIVRRNKEYNSLIDEQKKRAEMYMTRGKTVEAELCLLTATLTRVLHKMDYISDSLEK